MSLVMDADGQRTKMGPVFSFSLLSTIIDSLSSGSWVISVLTLLLSGLWPHVKLFLLLAAWLGERGLGSAWASGQSPRRSLAAGPGRGPSGNSPEYVCSQGVDPGAPS